MDYPDSVTCASILQISPPPSVTYHSEQVGSVWHDPAGKYLPTLHVRFRGVLLGYALFRPKRQFKYIKKLLGTVSY
jgi:hypothetical protein